MSNRSPFNPCAGSPLGGRSAVMLLALVGLVDFLQIPVQAQPKQPGPPAEGFYVDFRLQQELLPPWTFFGPDPLNVTRLEKQGLRITFPRRRKNPDRVGVQLTERIKGDFEITTTYEILKGDQPTEGHGVGVELFVATDSLTKEELAVFRMSRVNEGEVYTTSRATTEEGKRRYISRNIPTDCKSGRLRITRVGNEAVLWAAEGDSKDFQEIGREDLGPEDVTLVRVGAFPGHAQNELDVRIKELRVRGLSPAEAAALPVPLEIPKRDEGKSWLAVTLLSSFAASLLAAAALGGALYLRRRKPAVANKPPAPFLSIACPTCAKALKVKAELAGKKVKCIQCGKAVLVAEREDA